MERDPRDATPRIPHLHPPAVPPERETRADHDRGRLAPPVFPGGHGRERENGGPPHDETAAASGSVPDEAFIDPDEPIRTTDRFSDGAFIDPDEPIVRTRPPQPPEDFEEVLKRQEEEGSVVVDEELMDFDEMDVVVTGIGDDPHLDDEEISDVDRYGDSDVADLVRKVGVLADALRDKGEAGLRSTPGMTRFEATLRAYCVGYLAGRRSGAD